MTERPEIDHPAPNAPPSDPLSYANATFGSVPAAPGWILNGTEYVELPERSTENAPGIEPIATGAAF